MGESKFVNLYKSARILIDVIIRVIRVYPQSFTLLNTQANLWKTRTSPSACLSMEATTPR